MKVLGLEHNYSDYKILAKRKGLVKKTLAGKDSHCHHCPPGFMFKLIEIILNCFSLFEEYPTYKKFFTRSLVVSEDLLQSDYIKKHYIRILVPTLERIFQNLDHPEAVYEFIKKKGILYKKFELGIAREDLKVSFCEGELF